MKNLLTSAGARALNYFNSIQNRNVGPTGEAIANLKVFDKPLPEQPTDPEEVLRKLDEVGSPATMGIAGPRYFGFVIGGSFPVAIASPKGSFGQTGWQPRGIRMRVSTT